MQRLQRIQWAFYAVLAMAAFGAWNGALAHPHVWVTVHTDVLYNAQKAIIGFRHKWVFDEYYSQFAVMGLDKNNDGKYDRDELKELTEVNINSLKEFDYFTFPKVAGQLIERDEPKDYWLEYHDNRLSLFFTLPLKQPLAADKVKDFTFAVYDPTYFVDFSLAKEHPIGLSGAPEGCTPVVKDPAADTAQTSTSSSLGESFFNNAAAARSIAEQYAQFVSISCPAGRS